MEQTVIGDWLWQWSPPLLSPPILFLSHSVLLALVYDALH